MSAVQNAVESLMSISPAGDYHSHYNGTSTVGSLGHYCSSCNCYWTGIHTCAASWYPVYWAPPQVDKMQVAFKLVKHLISKDMVKLDKIEDFIALVDEIVTMI